MNFHEALVTRTAEVEAVIVKYLPKEEGNQKTVLKAMNYSVLAGGKRLRPLLMLESYQMFGGSESLVEPFMAALEMIHTYSLVHDDLEAMDNDEYRRGRKTTHIVYGEAMAILAGDGLLNLAFETAAEAFQAYPGNINAERALLLLGRKAGVFGMVGGQVTDIEAENHVESVSKEQLLFIHEKKTAALIQAALMIGAMLAGAGEKEVQAMETVGYNVGLAFQIQDDILDVTGTLEQLGKKAGSDAKNQKVTYVTMVGLNKALEEVKSLSEQALGILSTMPGDHGFMEQLIESLMTRNN